jgi:hypothetical protein
LNCFIRLATVRSTRPLEGADKFVDRHAPGLGLGDGDLLQGVLQVGAGGFQLLDQVGTVQQLERRGVVAVQPALKQPADAVAGVGGVEVGGLDAERIQVLLHLLGLAAVDLALGEDRDRLVFAGLGVEGFLADPHGDRPALLQGLLGGGQGVGADFCRHVERPLRADLAAHEQLVMDLVAHRQRAPRSSLMGYKTLR